MIGFRTLVFLLEAGYKVRAAVRNQAGFDRISQLKPVAPYAAQLSSIIVPDITVPGAYDEAVKDVEYIVHVASPLASNAPPGIDYDSYMIQPAIHGTVGILESAIKATSVKRIVITGSIMSVTTPAILGSGEYINGKSLLKIRHLVHIQRISSQDYFANISQRNHESQHRMVHSQTSWTPTPPPNPPP